MTTTNVKMWLIRQYFHDLTEYFAGDDGRFSRMVGREGKNFDTASPSGWAAHIVNCVTDDVRTHHGVEVERIYEQMRAWGVTP
jgi:hypothetical protein